MKQNIIIGLLAVLILVSLFFVRRQIGYEIEIARLNGAAQAAISLGCKEAFEKAKLTKAEK